MSHLSHFCQPSVMGILNVTPDSFALHCKDLDPHHIADDCARLLNQGADIIDIGACSTRPNAQPVSIQEEWHRLEIALTAIRKAFPQCVISVDTFRAEVAQRAIEEYQVNIINDISGMQDEQMLPLLAHTRVPYILTHPREACRGWNAATYVASEMLSFFSRQLDRLHVAGIADIIIDPGLGFGKTVEQNFALLHHLPLLKQLQVPILAGLSRKSMIYQTLQTTPVNALTGTIAAHMLALIQGANILRVHDVAEAKQTITIYQQYLNHQ